MLTVIIYIVRLQHTVFILKHLIIDIWVGIYSKGFVVILENPPLTMEGGKAGVPQVMEFLEYYGISKYLLQTLKVEGI